jgi:putative endonuclease
MTRGGYIYLLTNSRHTVFYTGVTPNLYVRITKHKEHFYPKAFSKRYNIYKLIYFERFDSIAKAIAREKQFKKYGRIKKIELINKFNPDWNDLYDTLDS